MWKCEGKLKGFEKKSFTGVFSQSHQGGLSSGWSLIWVVFHWGGLSSQGFFCPGVAVQNLKGIFDIV